MVPDITFHDSDYRQIKGNISVLKQIPYKSFDVIICHYVLENLENREELLLKFSKLLVRMVLFLSSSIIKSEKY